MCKQKQRPIHKLSVSITVDKEKETRQQTAQIATNVIPNNDQNCISL